MTPDDLAAIRKRDTAPIAGETWWGHYQAALQDRRALLAEVDRLTDLRGFLSIETLATAQSAERARIRAALPQAILHAYYREAERFRELEEWQLDLDNRFEWYASPNEMAEEIFAALDTSP